MKPARVIAYEIRKKMKKPEDFLSAEQDDSHLLEDNEDFLSEDMEPVEPKKENIPASDRVSDILKRIRARKRASK